MEENNDNQHLFSKRIRAGKRTYFFDIKPSKTGDYYITLTESIKKSDGKGFSFDKHKLFIYKEDISKFSEALEEAFIHLKTKLMPHYNFEADTRSGKLEDI
ncbi:MAG TPA: DNA-binding protein [Cytophagales bacterium]|nr:DNA-binding protein [Cytophagales bacterium]